MLPVVKNAVLAVDSDALLGPRVGHAARWRWMFTLTARVILLVLLAITLISTLAFYDVVDRHREEAAQVEAQALAIARITSMGQADLFAEARQLLATLARTPTVVGGDWSACARYLADVRGQFSTYANLGVIDPGGTLICSAVPVWTKIELSDRAYFKRAVSRRAFAVGDYQVGRATGKATINVGLPVVDPDGRVTAVVFAALDLGWVNHLAAQTHLPGGGSLTILDQSGTIIARYPDPARWVGRPTRAGGIASAVVSAGEGVTEAQGLDGTRSLFGFARLAGPDQKAVGYVVVGVHATAAYARANLTFARDLAGIGLVSLLAITTAWGGTKYYVLRPVRSLAAAADRLASGDLSARTGLSSAGELDALGSTFDRMATSLEQRSAALQDAESQYRALVEQSLTGIYLIVGNRFAYVNEAFANIFGYQVDEIAGRLGPTDLTAPGDQPLVAENVRARLAGDVEISHYTFRGLRRDGSLVDIDAFGRRLRYRGEPAILGTLVDITEQKRAADKIKSQIQQLAALRAIDLAIMASPDVRATLNVVLEQVTSELRVDAADVLLFDPDADTLTFVAGRGFRTSAPRRTTESLGDGYAGHAVRERTLVQVPDLRAAPEKSARASVFRQEDFVALYVMPLITKGKVQGVLELFHRNALAPDKAWLEFFRALAGQAAIAIDNASLFTDLQHANTELTLAYDRTIEGWSYALELRDPATEGHTLRVTELTVRLASAMGVPDAELVHIRRGSLLHDIGKMAVPDSILNKPGPLTDDERNTMMRHPTWAHELLSPITYLQPALDIPYCHHERWDGTGYPRRLKGQQIPLAARIFAVVDTWDALTTSRPYRPAWSEARARGYIREQAGKQFDPRVVDAFLTQTHQLA